MIAARPPLHLVLASCLALAAQDASPFQVEVGGSAAVKMEPGRTEARFEVVPERDGPLTIDVESADGDVFVRVLDASGNVVAQDDDSGVESNARLFVEGVRGSTLHLALGFVVVDDHARGLRVSVRAGSIRLPEGEELQQARSSFFRESARSCLARGRRLDGAVRLQVSAEIDYALGELARCQHAYRELLVLADELAHDRLRASARTRLGEILFLFDDPRGARDLLVQALEGAVALRDRVMEMFVRGSLGDAEQVLGDLDAARQSLEGALSIARETGDRGHEVVFLSRLGELTFEADGREPAEPLFSRALLLARDDGSQLGLVQALLRSGSFYFACADYRRARSHLEEAREVCEGEGLSKRTHSHILGILGDVALHTNDVLLAREIFGDVLEDARELGDVGLETSALKSLGEVYVWLGDFDEAQGVLEEALALLGSEGAPEKRAGILRPLALVHIERGDFAAADETLALALPLARSAGDGLTLALALEAKAALHYRQGDYAPALDLAAEILAIGSERDYAEVEFLGLDLVAELHIRLGDLAQAREPARRSVFLARELEDSRLLQYALLTSVEIAYFDGDVDAMTAIVAEAETCFENADLAKLDPGRIALVRAQEVFARWGEYSQDLVRLALSSDATDAATAKAAVREGFRRAGLWKGRALLQGIAEHRRGERSAAIIALRRELRDAVAERDGLLAGISSLRRRGLEEGAKLASMRERLDALRQHAAELEARLRERAPADAALDLPRGVDAESLEPLLGTDELLIDYVEGLERLYAYVLRDGELSFHDLGLRAELDRDVAAFLAGMTRPGRLSGVDEIATRGRRLYEELLEPLLSDGDASSRGLLVIPAPSLSALPLEALVVRSAENPASFEEVAFVLDRHEVSYATSTPVLTLLAAVGPRTEKGPALILGDPVYATEGEVPTRGAPSWERIPGTRAEAIAVASLLGSTQGTSPDEGVFRGMSRSGSLVEPAYSLHLGAEATPERLRGDLRRFAILHCASHGWVDPADPRESGLVLAPGADGDGLLRVADILELDLDAEVAVLSACDTGRGTIRPGEGVQSIARAFLYAGARSVVSSLWQVDDRETMEVMRRFYAEYVGRGRSRASALRSARLAVRHGEQEPGSYRGLGRGIATDDEAPVEENLSGHPFFWASFVYVGLPR